MRWMGFLGLTGRCWQDPLIRAEILRSGKSVTFAVRAASRGPGGVPRSWRRAAVRDVAGGIRMLTAFPPRESGTELRISWRARAVTPGQPRQPVRSQLNAKHPSTV